MTVKVAPPGTGQVINGGMPGVLDATSVAGVDPTGTTDSTTGLLNAISQAYTAAESLYVPQGNYLIGASGTGLDLSTLTWLGNTRIGPWQLYCDGGAVFIGNAALTHPVVNLEPPSGAQFLGCRFTFGKIFSHASTVPCLQVNQYSDGYLFAAWLEGGSIGLSVAQSSTSYPFGNNVVVCPLATNNGMGVQIAGGAVSDPNGAQGNQFFFGDLISNTPNDGINIDGTTGHNSMFNTFHVGVCEFNGRYGIADNNGSNLWFVSNTNSNSTKGLFIPSGANQAYVRGAFQDGISVGRTTDLINNNSAVGFQSSPPAVPGAGSSFTSTYDRPAMVYVTGGTSVVVSIDGHSTGLASGAFRVLPGQTIGLGSYTGSPTWAWFLTS